MFTRSAPPRSASITVGSATGAPKRLPPRIAVDVWPEPLTRTNWISSPFFSQIFASLATQGIQLDADSDVTPQLIFLSGLSCACGCDTAARQTRAVKKNLPANALIIESLPWQGTTYGALVTIVFLQRMVSQSRCLQSF